MKRFFLPAAMALCTGHAMAAGPYMVDDAYVVDAQTLQNENWLTRSDRQQTVAVVNIGYQLLPNAEFALQETHADDGGDRSDTLSPQVKYLWWESPSGKVASSVVLGGNLHLDESKQSTFYGYIPLTVQVADVLALHANLGAVHAPHTDVTWGVGLEYAALKHVALVAETFGRSNTKPGQQLGARVAITEHVLLDAVYGWNMLGAAEQSGTLGLTFSF